MVPKQLRPLFAIVAMGLALVTAGCAAPTSPAANEATPAANRVNVPRTRGVGDATTQPSTPPPAASLTTPSTPPGGTISLALFVEPSWKTSNASVVVNANGGKHVAFYYDEPIDEQRPTTAVYAYCPGQCEQADRWQRVQLAERVDEVQLVLNPAGKPRLLIRTGSTVYPNGKDYYFAACDGDCTAEEAWTLTYILSSHGTATGDFQDDELPQRSFALDPAGRPRFVYMDKNTIVNPNHLGVFYVFCDNDCTEQASWQQTRINELIPSPFRMEHIYYPALTFTPDGKPRLVTADFFPIDDGEPMLAYFECNDACTHSENWHKVSLRPRGGGSEPSADIEVDAAGRPRIAFYQEALLDNQGKRLSYLWCNDNCLVTANWQQRDLGLKSFDGQEPDLELDRHGRPRIAYADWNSGGLGYAWCNQQCDTTDAQWEHKLIETRTQLEAAWNVPFPRDHCDRGQWNSLTPTLAFGAGGDPYVAYDATYHARCFYDDDPTDNNPPEWRYEQVMRAVRLIAFTQPFTLPSDPPTSTTPAATQTPRPTTTPTATATPTVTPTPSPTPVAITKRMALFADTQWQTSSASVAVDADGGQHMAFYYDEAQTAGGPTHAVYRYCASGCENPANWQSVALAEQVNEVQLELTPAGNPRLLIRRASTTHQGGYDYLYAQCDSDCTQESGWELVQVASARGGASYEQQDARQPQRSFELDPSGRPRFVYLDDNPTADLHVGVFYAWCDEDCTSAAAWQEVRITELAQWDGVIEDQERALYLTLAFTREGYPRLITAEFFPLRGGEARLAYIACDTMCEVGYLWQKVQLYSRGEGPIPAADLEIDAEGHPHVAFYQGKTEGVFPDGSRPTFPESLLYATCPHDHCMTAWNWDAHHIGVSGSNGPAPDLELDRQGRPRIAYTHGETGGIGYSWCDADCLSFSEPSTWRHGVIETRAELQAAWPVDDPAHCEGGGWQGWTPTLVLSAAGDPHVAYDAAYVARCSADGHPNDASGHADVLRRAARLVTFGQP